MRIHKLIPLLALLVVLPLTTIPTIKHSLIAVEQGTISAQAAAEKKVKAQPGTSVTLRPFRATFHFSSVEIEIARSLLCCRGCVDQLATLNNLD